MIDRLYRGELCPCGRNFEHDAVYAEATKALLTAEDALRATLDDEGRRKLAALSDAYARQQEVLCQLSFRDGFCIAAGLWRDFDKWKEKENFIGYL